jgi:hypothetical protein
VCRASAYYLSTRKYYLSTRDGNRPFTLCVRIPRLRDSGHAIRAQKKPGFILLDETGQIPGDDLLSQDLSSHYHWR